MDPGRAERVVAAGMATHARPARIHWCDGSEAESNALREQLLDLSGLDLNPDALDQLLGVDVRGWLRVAEASEAFSMQFGSRLSAALQREQRALVKRLRAAIN